jgi:hypothetical protein
METRIIQDYPRYLVREDGNIISTVRNGTTLIPQYNPTTGYYHVSLCMVGNPRPKIATIHRLVAEAFISNPENKPQVNHIDGNKSNNHVSNLEWNTPIENITHAKITGLNNNFGESSPDAILTEADIFLIRNSTLTCKELGELFKVSAPHINKIQAGRCWKHLPLGNRVVKKSRSPLSEAEISNIFKLKKEGYSQAKIAELCNISGATVSLLVNQKSHTKSLTLADNIKSLRKPEVA